MKLVPNSAPILLSKCGHVGTYRPLRAGIFPLPSAQGKAGVRDPSLTVTSTNAPCDNRSTSIRVVRLLGMFEPD